MNDRNPFYGRDTADNMSRIVSYRDVSKTLGLGGDTLRGLKKQLNQMVTDITKNAQRNAARKAVINNNFNDANARSIENGRKKMEEAMRRAASTLADASLKHAVERVVAVMNKAAKAAETVKEKQEILAKAQMHIASLTRRASGRDKESLRGAVAMSAASLSEMNKGVWQNKANKIGLDLNRRLLGVTHAIATTTRLLVPLKRSLDIANRFYHNVESKFNMLAKMQMGIARERGAVGRRLRGAGLNPRDIMGMLAAGRKSGLSDQEVINQAVNLQGELANARWGEGDLINKLGRWGLSPYKHNGKVKNTHELMIEISDKINKMTDPMEQQQFAGHLGFGPEKIEYLKRYAKEEREWQRIKNDPSKHGILERGRTFDESGMNARISAEQDIEKRRQEIENEEAILGGAGSTLKRKLNSETWFFKDYTIQARGAREAEAQAANEALIANGGNINKLTDRQREALSYYGEAAIRNGGYKKDEALARRKELAAMGVTFKKDPIERIHAALGPVTDKLGSFIEKMGDFLGDKAAPMVDYLATVAERAFGLVREALPSWDQFKKGVDDFLKSPWEETKRYANAAIEKIWDFSEAAGKVILPKVWEAVKEHGKVILPQVWDVVVKAGKLALGPVLESSTNAIHSSFHGTESKATGGAISKGGTVLVNEKGPELISDKGRAYIANGGKPGFVHLSGSAVVFNAEETKRIKGHGSVRTPYGGAAAAGKQGDDIAALLNLTQGMSDSEKSDFLRRRNAILNQTYKPKKFEPTLWMKTLGWLGTAYNSLTSATLSPMLRAAFRFFGAEDKLTAVLGEGYGMKLNAEELADLTGLDRETYDKVAFASDIGADLLLAIGTGGISALAKGAAKGAAKGVAKGVAKGSLKGLRKLGSRRLARKATRQTNKITKLMEQAAKAEKAGDSKKAAKLFNRALKEEARLNKTKGKLAKRGIKDELNAAKDATKVTHIHKYQQPLKSRLINTSLYAGALATQHGFERIEPYDASADTKPKPKPTPDENKPTPDENTSSIAPAKDTHPDAFNGPKKRVALSDRFSDWKYEDNFKPRGSGTDRWRDSRDSGLTSDERTTLGMSTTLGPGIDLGPSIDLGNQTNLNYKFGTTSRKNNGTAFNGYKMQYVDSDLAKLKAVEKREAAYKKKLQATKERHAAMRAAEEQKRAVEAQKAEYINPYTGKLYTEEEYRDKVMGDGNISEDKVSAYVNNYKFLKNKGALDYLEEGYEGDAIKDIKKKEENTEQVVNTVADNITKTNEAADSAKNATAGGGGGASGNSVVQNFNFEAITSNQTINTGGVDMNENDMKEVSSLKKDEIEKMIANKFVAASNMIGQI